MRSLSRGRQLCYISTTTLPRSVRIVEVGPRDGLQNERTLVAASVKTSLIRKLYDSGLRHIEAGAFVSPKWVPQMSTTPEVFEFLRNNADGLKGATFSALVPNAKGLETAVALGVKEVAIFGAASEAFSQKNINCSIEQSFERFKEVVSAAPLRLTLGLSLGHPFLLTYGC